MDEIRIPASLAGDLFYAASRRIQDQDHHDRYCFCGCYEGVVYLGELVEDPETGEEVDVIEAVPCRRCAVLPNE